MLEDRWNTNHPNPTAAMLAREADRERHEAYIAREMKPANDLMALFLSKKDEMAALSEQFRAPAIDVACVFEALAEWHHELLKRAG